MKPAENSKLPGQPIISVVLMAFNEGNGLEEAVREILIVLKELKESYEIVIVDDGSSDSTGAVADQLAGDLAGVRVIHHPRNLGLGGVYRTGFASARGELITFFPADRQFPATIIDQFLSIIPGQDMVLGYLPKRKDPLVNRALSRAEKILYRILFGPMPRFQGILMFRRKLLAEIELKSRGRGWAVLMELIIRASRSGYRIKSAPTEFRPRTIGNSKVGNLSTVWANFQQVVVLRLLF